jgi:hypothetical protein
VEAHGRDSKQALEETRCDIDELHAPIRDDRKPLDQHASAYKKVVIARKVSPTGTTSVDEDPRKQAEKEDPSDDSARPNDAELGLRHDAGDRQDDERHEPNLAAAHATQLWGRSLPERFGLDIGYLDTP